MFLFRITKVYLLRVYWTMKPSKEWLLHDVGWQTSSLNIPSQGKLFNKFIKQLN